MTDLLRELEWRGFVRPPTPGLVAHLAKGPVPAYCGFDPTTPSLQLGNLMPLMLLRNLQLHGHRPILLRGGGTGLIGDPSGKRTERPLLTKEQLRENLQRMRDHRARCLDIGEGPRGALVLDNAKWLGSLGLIDFLRDVGKHFTVNVMLQKESVQARLDSGLSYTEFSYMLLQAYDFLHLYRERACTDSFCSMTLTVKCLPTSRRKSIKPSDPSHLALSSTRAPLGPSPMSRNRAIWSRMRWRFSRSCSLVRRGRSVRLPEGSPIRPVPPPISTMGRWPWSCRFRSSISGIRLPSCRLGVGGSKPQ